MASESPWPCALGGPGNDRRSTGRGARSGRIRWVRRWDSAPLDGMLAGPGALVVVATGDGSLRALAPDGSDRWTATSMVEAGSQSRAVFAGGNLLALTPDGIAAIAPETGLEAWRVPAPPARAGKARPPALAADERHAYLLFPGGRDARLFRVDLGGGALEPLSDETFVSPVAALPEGRVLAGASTEGRLGLVSIDAVSGAVHARNPDLGRAPYGPPVACGGEALVGGTAGAAVPGGLVLRLREDLTRVWMHPAYESEECLLGLDPEGNVWIQDELGTVSLLSGPDGLTLRRLGRFGRAVATDGEGFLYLITPGGLEIFAPGETAPRASLPGVAGRPVVGPDGLTLARASNGALLAVE